MPQAAATASIPVIYASFLALDLTTTTTTTIVTVTIRSRIFATVYPAKLSHCAVKLCLKCCSDFTCLFQNQSLRQILTSIESCSCREDSDEV